MSGMDLFNNQDYLLNDQYKDAGNLSARANLHVRFSTNTYGWHRWVFDQFSLRDNAAVLEVGSGPGWLWHENRARVPAGWRLTLTDFSPGMIDESQRNLADLAAQIIWRQADAQNLPFEAGAFDAVVANHMLYHVPDRAAAVREFHRVLKPGGWLYCATNGAGHLHELDEIGVRFVREVLALEGELEMPSARAFALENGAALLDTAFTGVELRRYVDALVVTEVEPLLAYIRSGKFGVVLTDDIVAALHQFLADEMARGDGAIRITKDAGLFLAQK